MPREVEAKLAAVAEPEATRRQLAATTHIAGYRLAPPRTVTIRDRVFDTPRRDFQKNGLMLRTRRSGGRELLTFKAGSAASSGGMADRLEIELPWTDGSLRRILGEAKKRGVSLAPLPSRSATRQAALQRMGLTVVQDRSTKRTSRRVLDSSRREVAELDSDAVVYKFDRRAVRHYEVEIEAKSKGGRSAVETILQDLAARFQGRLIPWKWSKTATGHAIGELYKTGVVKRTNRRGSIATKDYALVDRWLRSAGRAVK